MKIDFQIKSNTDMNKDFYSHIYVNHYVSQFEKKELR